MAPYDMILVRTESCLLMRARFKRWWERRKRAAFDRRSGILPRVKSEIDFLSTLWAVGEDVLGEQPIAKDFELRGWPPVRRVPRYPRPPAPPVDHPAFGYWQKLYGCSEEEWREKGRKLGIYYDSDRS